MLLHIRVFLSIFFIATALRAQQSAIYTKQNELTGIIKSATLDNEIFVYSNGKEFIVEDVLGNVRYRRQVVIPGNALIRDLKSANQNIYALYQVISNGQLQFGVLMLNAQLEMQWYKVFGASGASLSAYSLATDGINSYVVNNNCTNGLSITKLNNTGEVVWNKTWHTASGTIIPEYVTIQSGKLSVYSKQTTGNQVSLVISVLSEEGQLEKSDKYVLNESFVIKSVSMLSDVTYLLLNYTSGTVSSELLKLQNGTLKGYLFNAPQPLQWNALTTYNQELYICGNIYKGDTEHLNAVLLCINDNLSIQFTKQLESSYNNNLGYDDALSLAATASTVIVNGIHADKGFVISYNKNYGGLCQSNDLNIGAVQQINYQKSSTTLTEGSTPEYNKINAAPVVTELIVTPADYCAYEVIAYNSIEDYASSERTTINIFPNPASDLIKIDVTGNQNTLSWEMSDISGRILKSGLCSSQKTQLSVSDLPNGLYIIHWKSGFENGVSRLIIVR